MIFKSIAIRMHGSTQTPTVFRIRINTRSGSISQMYRTSQFVQHCCYIFYLQCIVKKISSKNNLLRKSRDRFECRLCICLNCWFNPVQRLCIYNKHLYRTLPLIFKANSYSGDPQAIFSFLSRLIWPVTVCTFFSSMRVDQKTASVSAVR